MKIKLEPNKHLLTYGINVRILKSDHLYVAVHLQMAS